jgi:phosphoglycolate phosphatase-like HAD superfamily hydrolase
MPLPPLRYRAVLFDLDGTLVDSYAALAEAVNFARREHGLHERVVDGMTQRAFAVGTLASRRLARLRLAAACEACEGVSLPAKGEGLAGRRRDAAGPAGEDASVPFVRFARSVA